MPMGVVALGGMAGSMAAQKLMKTDKQAPAGGGIPGLTTSKGAGKNGDKGTAVQVDPTAALAYFTQATSVNNAGFDQGVQYYKTAIDKASQEIKTGYAQANQTLQPMSFAAGQALNQQMRMLGMDPLPATNGMGQALIQSFGQSSIAANASAKESIANLAQQMDAAGKIKDPNQRAVALQQIQQLSGTGLNDTVSNLKQQIEALGNAPVDPLHRDPSDPLYAQYRMERSMAGIGGLTYTPSAGDKVQGAAAGGAKDTARTFQTQMDAYTSQKNSLQKQLDAATEYQNTLKEYGGNFANNYDPNYDSGYSPQQIENVVTNLPGYQFQLAQGQKAIERTASARGMLNSGNTQLGLQDFGQGHAMGYYNQYMGYLQGVQQQGAPATMQISANQSSQGTALANLAQNYGMAQMDTERQKANFAAQSLMQAGQLFNQTSMFNAAAQNQAISQMRNQESQQQNQAMASGPGYMNAYTASSAQQYNQLQGARQASAMYNTYSGGSSGGTGYTGYGNAGNAAAFAAGKPQSLF